MGLSDRKMMGQARRIVSFLNERQLRREAALIAPFVDDAFYLDTYEDVSKSGHSPSYHYSKHGWREGRDPSAHFSTGGYLAAHPNIALSGKNPLLDFVEEHQSTLARNAQAQKDLANAHEVHIIAPHVDDRFYLTQVRDLNKTGLTAAQHYHAIGWREGHDPGPDFSTSYYLTTNPDVRERGVNPFWHFLITGKDEGRLPTHPGGWRHGVLSSQRSFDQVCKGWQRRDSPPKVMGVGEIRAAIAKGRRANHLMITLGHDDYRATPGGVQLCIELEEQRAADFDTDYLNLHPWQPLPKLAEPDSDPVVWLVLNGRTIGAAKSGDISRTIGSAAERGKVHLVIHHLAGHKSEFVSDLAKALGVSAVTFWLHDYFSLCTSFALQRNNVAPCEAPDPASNACGICHFGQARRPQLERMQTLFQSVPIDVVSPSKAAADFWAVRTGLDPRSLTIRPHLELEECSETSAPKSFGPVKIAFVGTRAPHKGWQVFLEIAKRLQSDPGYSFVYFGQSDPEMKNIGHVQTHVRANNPMAISSAIEEAGIDLVLHWAMWRETFSFSTFEAFCGGAFVLTNKGSGNVAAAVLKYQRGMVLPDEGALYDLIKSGDLLALAQTARARRQAVKLVPKFSDMSHDRAVETLC